MRYYLIAGEASGDLHASNLIKHLKQIDKSSVFRGWGGDKMADNGAEIVKHYKDLAFMGFVEVVINLKTIVSNLTFCKRDILEFKPDAVILIDYPGFNLRIAEFLHQKGIKTIYYISPQVWAWKKSRVFKIKKVVDKLLVILPFESDFYKKYNVEAQFVGHPLLDEISGEFAHESILPPVDKVVLLPGSRKQEISVMLPIMLSIVGFFPDIEFVVAGVSSISEDFYKAITKNTPVTIEFNNTYNLLRQSKAAIVTSGTATLETAIIGVPEVVCYKANSISYFIARQLIKVKYISLVNLIMDKLVVKELIQHDLTTIKLKTELNNLLYNPEYRNRLNDDYKNLRELLGGVGASLRAANSIYQFLLQEHSK